MKPPAVPIVFVLALMCCRNAGAQIGEVGPFTGVQEDFESFGLTFTDEITVFGGTATLGSTTGGDAVFVVGSSTFNGITIQPHAGARLGGVAAPARWEFPKPVQQFGGYFATNSGADDAVVEFFDAGGQLIGSQTATITSDDAAWHWNGWSSTVPISRVIVTSHGTSGGFIEYDDMMLTYPAEPVPAASTWGLIVSSLVLLCAGTVVMRKSASLSGPAGRSAPFRAD